MSQELELFKLQAPIIIKHDIAENWTTKSLREAQLGYITDKHFMIIGNGEDGVSPVVEDNIVWDSEEEKFKLLDLPRIPVFFIAPMFGEVYEGTEVKKDEDGKIYIDKRKAEDYVPIDGAILLLYDNRNDYSDPSKYNLNPEYIE